MPRLLLVFPNLANVVSHELVRVLRRWGYETALAGYVNTTTLKTHDGTEIDPNSNTARNYLRQFDAVCVFDTARFDEMGSTPSDACSLWLQWNDDADPPVLFFGMHLHSGRSALDTRLPSDFPIGAGTPAIRTPTRWAKRPRPIAAFTLSHRFCGCLHGRAHPSA